MRIDGRRRRAASWTGLPRRLGWGVLAAVSAVGGAWACGPWLHPVHLLIGQAVLDVPMTGLTAEVAAIEGFDPPAGIPKGNRTAALWKVPASGDHEPSPPQKSQLDWEIAELTEVLEASDPSGAARAATVERYRVLREAMFFEGLAYQGRAALGEVELRVNERLVGSRVPDGLPREFALYLEGALRYRLGELEPAVARWKELLALPEDERRHRSVWAAWMLAKSSGSVDEAVRWYRETISLVGAGFHDSIGLAPAALGWLARHALDDGRRADAIEAYFHQAASGSESGLLSLMHSVPTPGFSDEVTPAAWREIVSRPLARRLVTARLLDGLAWDGGFYWSPGAPEPVEAWLDLLEGIEITGDDESVRLAWACYGAGLFDAAGKWLAKADDESGIAWWLRGKLALRSGDRRRAVACFSNAVERIGPPDDASWVVRPDTSRMRTVAAGRIAAQGRRQFFADLGVVRLSTSDFVQALDAFLESGYLQDAAYVAENLLSREELLAFTRSRIRGGGADPGGEGRSAEGSDSPDSGGTPDPRPSWERVNVWSGDGYRPRAWLRYLTARRLARERFFKDARPLLPDDLVPILDRYVDRWRRGHDEALPDAERADSLWEAACIHRAFGIELFGTEGAPDFAQWDGLFTTEPIARVRAETGVDRQSDPMDFVLPPGPDERWALRRYRVEPDFRFHYRHVAADLAWEACALMPDEDEEAARRLCVAGSWLETRHPKEADRFYKEMIWKNWSTPLARKADELRWFPESDWDQGAFRRTLVEELGIAVPDWWR